MAPIREVPSQTRDARSLAALSTQPDPAIAGNGPAGHRPAAKIKSGMWPKSGPTEVITSLNRALAAWANHFRYGVSKAVFGAVDHHEWVG